MLSYVRTLLVVAFFVFMMTRLVRDHLMPSWEQGELRTANAETFVNGWEDKDEWTAVSVAGIPIGGMRSKSQTLSKEYGLTSHLVLSAGGGNANIRVGAKLDQKLALQQFEVILNYTGSQGGPIHLMGRVYNGKLKLKLKSDTGVKFHQIKLEGPITILDVVNPLFRSGVIQEGQTYQIQVYDPIWKVQSGSLKVKLEGPDALPLAGKNVMCRKMSAELNNVKMFVWVDAGGIIWRREIPIPGLEMQGGATSGKGPSLVVEHLEEEEGKSRFPELISTDLLPELAAEDFEGQDQGDPTQGMGIIPMLLKSKASAAMK